MNTVLIKSRFERPLIATLERMPYVSLYAKTRGWPFIISWCHRIAGMILLVFVCYHIYSLTALYSPALYDAKMKIFGFFILAILEWALAIPVIFHAFNGGRLILYESFGMRNDEGMIRWTLSLSVLYVALLGLLMLLSNQSVSAFFFWITMFVTALALLYGVASKIWRAGHSIFWKLQRISGAFLLVMVPAHLLFMHLNPTMAKDANLVIMRVQNLFIKAVDLALLLGALYHGGYGLLSVVKDYLSSGILRIGLTALVTLVMVIFAWVGIKLIITL